MVTLAGCIVQMLVFLWLEVPIVDSKVFNWHCWWYWWLVRLVVVLVQVWWRHWWWWWWLVQAFQWWLVEAVVVVVELCGSGLIPFATSIGANWCSACTYSSKTLHFCLYTEYLYKYPTLLQSNTIQFTALLHIFI